MSSPGEGGYSGGFIEHYVLPVIYPAGLTRNIQLWLGLGVLVVNVIAYAVDHSALDAEQASLTRAHCPEAPARSFRMSRLV